MVMVKLRETKRYFEDDDTSFYIQGKQELMLPETQLKSYSIKQALFHGDLLVTEGEFLLHFKAAKVYIGINKLYYLEEGQYYKKDLESDIIKKITVSKVPKSIKNKLDSL